MAQEKILAKGLRFFDKKASQPDFVIASLVITKNEVLEMFAEQREHVTPYNGKDQLRLQVLKSKEGGLYATVDTWKATGAVVTARSEPVRQGPTPGSNDDLPF